MSETLFGKIGRLVFGEAGGGNSFFTDKARGADFQQLAALPPDLQAKLLDGNSKECAKALGEVRRLEYKSKSVLLGQAAMELIHEERERRRSNTPQPEKTLSR